MLFAPFLVQMQVDFPDFHQLDTQRGVELLAVPVQPEKKRDFEPPRAHTHTHTHNSETRKMGDI